MKWKRYPLDNHYLLGKGNVSLMYRASWKQEWLFSPERGNVVFASSLYCWAFGLSTFARIWALKLGIKRGLLFRHLWGDFIFNPKTLTVHRYTSDSISKPMFVSMILEPIWQLYEVAVLGQDLERVSKMIKRLGLVRFLKYNE